MIPNSANWCFGSKIRKFAITKSKFERSCATWNRRNGWKLLRRCMSFAAKRQKMSENPLDKLDFNDASFKSGVEELAQILDVPRHPDHLVTLEACCLLIQERLSSVPMEQDGQDAKKPQVSALALEEYPLGLETGDKILDNAGRVLRLLHIREIRDLQTRINEIIVAEQNVTADPKVAQATEDAHPDDNGSGREQPFRFRREHDPEELRGEVFEVLTPPAKGRIAHRRISA